jgi:outer membrane beta-barrel protein
MKKVFLFVAFVMMMAVSSIAQAEVKAGSVSVTPFAGGYFFEGNQDYKDNVTIGLRAGYNFTENLGLELFGTWLESEFKETDSINRVYVAGLEGIYHFMPESRFVPFVAVGIGAIHYSSDDSEYLPSKFAIDYGAGVKYFIAENVALRADVRHVIPMGESEKYGDNPGYTHNDLLATVGITFSFGGTKQEAASARVEEPYVPASPVAEAQAEPPVEQEPVAPAAQLQEPAAEAGIEEPAVAQAIAAPVPAPVVAKEAVRKTSEENIRGLVEKWLNSWQSGDMETYRDCYASDFKSKGMDLDAWMAYKINVRRKSKNISIRLENLKIFADEKNAAAKAVFTQYYSSSIFKDTVKKTLILKEIDNEWKIYRETIIPVK